MANIDTEELLSGGPAFEQMLSGIDTNKQIEELKGALAGTKSVSKKDQIIKRIKYLAGLKKVGLKADEAYVLHNIPVLPPICRPVIPMSGARVEYSDLNMLYRDHMLVNNSFKDIKDILPNDQLMESRKNLYDGMKAIQGLGEAITGSSRGKDLKGTLHQISGTTGPKTGFFHSKILSKKQDFSARATIYAEPNLGFNEAGIPKDMIWKTYEFHIIRALVKQGFDYVSAKKAVTDRTPAAMNAFSKVIKEVPIIFNRAPTLMASNVTAFFPVPIEGKTVAFNPTLLPLMAADFDGDAGSLFVPMTPSAVKEAKEKLLPMHHMHDYRKGIGNAMVAPAHEAVIGSVFMTEPDTTQKTVTFKSEADAIIAFKNGSIKENTPVRIQK